MTVDPWCSSKQEGSAMVETSTRLICREGDLSGLPLATKC